ncbi:MAG: pyrophosphate--fructose-6-phosphate 1-phosphotransferase [Opitutaceae bacterium]|nr:pyrophosphate--fructose-6-phosphate 1-phosphotransferase [Opitutaceae bacterium]
MQPKKVAILTAGGLAPCLSAAIGDLVQRYTEVLPSTEIICYRSGYKGLLLGDSIKVTPELRTQAGLLHKFGGSPIGNSRVKLTNISDCVKRGLVKEGQDPRRVAADQLVRDGIDVLHTIGGDDTSTAAADLAAFLRTNNYRLTVVGLPKTIDNDIIPVRQSLGAWTAAEQGALFFRNIVTELGSSPRMLIIHEVMGRHCGWLAAATAQDYMKIVDAGSYAPGFGLIKERYAVHGLYLPELKFDIAAEADRLRRIFDQLGNINLFISEGACVPEIVAELEKRGEKVQRDPFGHVKLDTINPGKWFGDRFSKLLGAEKVMVQKSGYFARSASANARDLQLIKKCADKAVACALTDTSGLVGQDEERGDELRAVEFPRVKGGKAFDVGTPWFREMMARLGQPVVPASGCHG